MKSYSFLTVSLLIVTSLCVLSTQAVATCSQSDIKGIWNLTGDGLLVAEGYDPDFDTAISTTPQPLGSAWCHFNVNLNGVVRGGLCIEPGDSGRQLKPISHDEFGDPLSRFILDSKCKFEGVVALYDPVNPEVEPVVCAFVHGAIDIRKSTINSPTACVLLRTDNLWDIITYSIVGVRRL